MIAKKKTLVALVLAVFLTAGAGALVSSADESEASPNLVYIEPTSDFVYCISVGHTISADLSFGVTCDIDIVSKPIWMSISGTTITGAAPAIGVYSLEFNTLEPDGFDTNYKVQFHAVLAGDVDLSTIRYYAGLYDNKVMAIDYTSGSNYIVSSINVGEQVATEYYYNGTYVTPSQTISIINNSDLLPNIQLKATKIGAPLLEVPYTAPSGNAVAGVNWSWTPTTLSGAVVTVSGVDWLSVSGTSVYGVPPALGDYEITVTIAKDGYSDRTETFVLTVVSKLVPTNSPLNGAIFKL